MSGLFRAAWISAAPLDVATAEALLAGRGERVEGASAWIWEGGHLAGWRDPEGRAWIEAADGDAARLEALTRAALRAWPASGEISRDEAPWSAPWRPEGDEERLQDRWFDETIWVTRLTETIHAEISPFQDIRIAETARYGRVLFLDGDVQSATFDEAEYHAALVHPVMCAHPAPRRVLIGGGGEGATAREILRHPTVEEVVMVDIDARCVAACRRHLPGHGAGAWGDPRLKIIHGDFNAALVDAGRFDVILVDLTDDAPIAIPDLLAGALREGGVLGAQMGEHNPLSEDPYAKLDALRGRFPQIHPYAEWIDSFIAYWSFCVSRPPIRFAPELGFDAAAWARLQIQPRGLGLRSSAAALDPSGFRWLHAIKGDAAPPERGWRALGLEGAPSRAIGRTEARASDGGWAIVHRVRGGWATRCVAAGAVDRRVAAAGWHAAAPGRAGVVTLTWGEAERLHLRARASGPAPAPAPGGWRWAETLPYGLICLDETGAPFSAAIERAQDLGLLVEGGLDALPEGGRALLLGDPLGALARQLLEARPGCVAITPREWRPSAEALERFEAWHGGIWSHPGCHQAEEGAAALIEAGGWDLILCARFPDDLEALARALRPGGRLLTRTAILQPPRGLEARAQREAFARLFPDGASIAPPIVSQCRRRGFLSSDRASLQAPGWRDARPPPPWA